MKNLEMKYINSPIILGIIGGLLGAFFINVNSRLGALRKKIVKSKTKKIIEVIFFACITMSICFMITCFHNECISI